MIERIEGRIIIIRGWSREMEDFLSGDLEKMKKKKFDILVEGLVQFKVIVWMIEGEIERKDEGKIRSMMIEEKVGWWLGLGYLV